jgi:CRISPR/Cas system endoribonuclease Cas6 (RAMP superfamily)
LDPFLILNSLARRWNNHCPSDLLLDWEDVKTLQGASTLVILDGDVERVRERGRGVREGFVGVATMETTAQEGLFSSLMRAVEFLGVGAGTTRGYGVVEAQLLAS